MLDLLNITLMTGDNFDIDATIQSNSIIETAWQANNNEYYKALSMDDIINLVVIIILAVLIATIVYKILPFRNLAEKKPGFTLFPKYAVSFDKPVAEIESALSKLEFSKTDNGTYTRGKIYGDFSAKSVKLTVQIDAGQGQIKVYAPFFGILFDTGDLWQVTTDILNA